jgi:hypothetical protein
MRDIRRKTEGKWDSDVVGIDILQFSLWSQWSWSTVRVTYRDGNCCVELSNAVVESILFVSHNLQQAISPADSRMEDVINSAAFFSVLMG